MGVVLAGLGADATVTDIDESCLQASRVNTRLNGMEKSCKVFRLAYGRGDAERFAAAHGDAFDFIFGADILYDANVASLLFESVERLLAPSGCFLLGVVERNERIPRRLREAAAEAGFCFDPPRGVGKEFAHLCPALRGRRAGTAKAEEAKPPRAGLGGALFNLQQELRAFEKLYDDGHGFGLAAGERPESVELYCFVRRGAYRLDQMD